MDPGKVKNEKAKAHRQVVGPRLWLFRITALTIIPAVLLILAEVCLRMTGFGYPTSAVIERDFAGKRVCINNLKFGWRFFPKQIARELDTFIFPVEKPPQTYRIFVLGASAALGTPDSAYGFSRILKVLLDNEYQDLNFEVINTGITAVNSHSVLEIAKDCARYEPDLFIIYLGNNEVTGPYGAGTVYAPFSPSLSAIRASIASKSTKLGQLLEGLLNTFKAKRRRPLRWGGLQMHLDKQVRFDSQGLQYVYKHYENNLTDICNIGAEAGANVILCNIATNLKDCPPFASLNNPDLKQTKAVMWGGFYNKAVQLESEGKYARALEQYLSAVKIDDQFAELLFRMGRCYWEIGKYDQAEDSFIKARSLDTLRFRADNRINEIIHRVANKAANQISLVDAVKVCRDASPHGIPGKELFFEHVHFNFRGNYLLARTILGQVEKAIFKQRGIKKAPPKTSLSEKECRTRLAFTGWDRLRVIRKVLNGFIKMPPFTNQTYYEQRVARIEGWIKSLQRYTTQKGLQESKDIYRQAIEWSPSDWQLYAKYGQFLSSALGDNEGAISQWNMAISRVPHCYYIRNKLSVVLHTQGKIDESMQMARLAMEINPLDAWTYCNLARGFQKKKQWNTALEYYAKALKINPRISADIYGLMAQILHHTRQDDKAIDILRGGVKVFPESADLHYVIGIYLKEQGKITEATNEFRAAMKAQPNHIPSRKALMALERKN